MSLVFISQFFIYTALYLFLYLKISQRVYSIVLVLVPSVEAGVITHVSENCPYGHVNAAKQTKLLV